MDVRVIVYRFLFACINCLDLAMQFRMGFRIGKTHLRTLQSESQIDLDEYFGLS